MNFTYYLALIISAITWFMFFITYGLPEMYGWIVAATGWTFLVFNERIKKNG